MNVTVEVQRESAASDLPADEDLQRWIEAALSGADGLPESPIGPAAILIRIVDEQEGRQLNAEYRQRDYPTNVLSFPADLAEMPEELRNSLESQPLGDLVICAPVVAREAAEQGKVPESHWAHMVVHGCLHLLGHDHIEDTEAEAMETLETAIMGRLGYPNPYIEEY